jgi:hypothetical protein
MRLTVDCSVKNQEWYGAESSVEGTMNWSSLTEGIFGDLAQGYRDWSLLISALDVVVLKEH